VSTIPSIQLQGRDPQSPLPLRRQASMQLPRPDLEKRVRAARFVGGVASHGIRAV
jgi:hypothetical protein